MEDKLNLDSNEGFLYKPFEEDQKDSDEIEKCIDLLYRYLNQFITKENLKKDVINCLEEGRVLGAYAEDKLIGAVAGVYTPFFDKFHIAHLAVEEQFRERGIGSELVHKVIPENKSATVHLNIENPEIEKFYKKMEFKATHKRFKKIDRPNKEIKPSD
jgi:GNAT superfamily N-acetyltransferase